MANYMTVKDVENLLGISKNHAYKLFRTKGFPAVQIGSKYIIEEEALHRFMKEHEGERIFLN